MELEEIHKRWWSRGPVFKDKLVCQYARGATSHGIWYGHNPLDDSLGLFLFEMFLIFSFNRAIYYLLNPLGQSLTVAQIVVRNAGIIIGPSFLTHNKRVVNKLFPPPGRYILKTISGFAFVLHLFILGVKIDMSSVKNNGAKSTVIGFSGLLFSLLFGSSAFVVVRQLTELDQSQYSGIRVLIFFNSLTFFMVTNSYIHDLKLSNSEMGRLASSSSLVVDAFGLFTTLFILLAVGPKNPDAPQGWMFLVPTGFYYFVMFCIFRPIVLHIVKRTPEGASMKQTHFLLILVIVLLESLWGEFVGQKFAVFFFGLSLPDGHPLGYALAQKLELITSGILLPVFCTLAGWRTNVSSLRHISSSQLWGTELIFVIGQIGKLFGSFMSAIFLGVSFEDAVPFSFMMSFKGILEIATIGAWKDNGIVDEQLFSLSMINIVLFTGVAFPIVQLIYDPSSRYNIVRKRGVMGLGGSGDLSILLCIHKEATVPTMVNLLEVSKTNKEGGSISVFVLQLIQLTGSAMPILSPLHNYKSPAHFNQLERTANALQQFEDQSQGFARVQHLVSVAPYKGMHDDICSIAHEKSIRIIILPFHKEWGVNGEVNLTSSQIRDVNRRVLGKAPCSVAILIDKGSGTGAVCYFQIVMLFVGGSDDHEALALARRMADRPNVRLTVIWLKLIDYKPQLHDSQEDIKVMTDFHMKSNRQERIQMKETVVGDAIGTTKVVLSMQHADLFMVGRYHEPDCPAILGLNDWSESSELGAMGEMLATSDFQFSILVVQQQPRIDWDINQTKRTKDDAISSVNNDSSPTNVRSTRS